MTKNIQDIPFAQICHWLTHPDELGIEEYGTILAYVQWREQVILDLRKEVEALQEEIAEVETDLWLHRTQ